MLIQTVDRDAPICKGCPYRKPRALTQKEQGAAPNRRRSRPAASAPSPLVDGNDVRAAIG